MPTLLITLVSAFQTTVPLLRPSAYAEPFHLSRHNHPYTFFRPKLCFALHRMKNAGEIENKTINLEDASKKLKSEREKVTTI